MNNMVLEIKSKIKNYSVVIEKKCINHISLYYQNKGRPVIITDSGIPEKWVNIVKKQFENPLLITVKQGEKAKSIKVVEHLIESMLKEKICRDDFIIALGGGVIGDLAGFVASIYMRGIEYINIPTTLLSQVDSSVGGKVAINSKNSKNAIGAFYPPTKVLIDGQVLETLHNKEVLSGLGEIFKYALISDKIMYEDLKESNLKQLSDYVEKCVKIKKEIVESDELENGIRKVLNFGHTLGHAIEILTKGKMSHGECVVIGMLLISKNLPVYKELEETFLAKGFKIKVEINSNKIIEIVKNDKKAHDRNTIDIVLLEEIGKSKIEKVNYEYIEKLLEIKK